MASGTESGWHHHGSHCSYLYVARGSARFETPEGVGADADAGDFIFIGPDEVHPEINPGTEVSEVVLFRIGTGPIVVNVQVPGV